VAETVVRIGVLNIKRGCWNAKTRWHELHRLRDIVAKAPTPHVLFLSECTMWMAFQQQPLWEAVGLLDDLWEGDDFFRPWMSQRKGSRNKPGMVTSARLVKPKEVHEVADPDVREVYYDVLEATIAGIRTFLSPIHWTGARGPVGMDIQASLSAQLGQLPSIIGGDFNTTSSADGEHLYEDWGARCDERGRPWQRTQKGRRDSSGRWTTNTESMDTVLSSGLWDVGERARDFTPTSAGGLRIDRIVVSKEHPADYVEGSYRVIPCPGSDHDYVYAELAFDKDS
jgi:endonuclease/exonuclease/phosphatase family metal-dependent hydrolase